ncbi:Type-2 restriction enzyme AplI [anaerobic digester metagenome]
MNKIEEAQDILKSLGLPQAQYNEMAALTLLALCNIKESDDWKNASRKSLGVSKGIMSFVNENYNKTYAPNTRETFRRQVLHQFVQARIVDYNPDIPDLAVNSPRAHYALTKDVLKVVKSYQTPKWDISVQNFLKIAGRLSEKYLKERKLNQIPVTLSNGEVLILSAGKHNEVQAAIVEQFAPRFAAGGILLYLGDTEKKINILIRTG